MTYVVTEKCIGCKFTDCVEVCPVDAFRENPMMLVIEPSVCIDCGVCEPQCPIGAIAPDSQVDGKSRKRNQALSQHWPAITCRREPLPQAHDLADAPGKFGRYLLPTLTSELAHDLS